MRQTALATLAIFAGLAHPAAAAPKPAPAPAAPAARTAPAPLSVSPEKAVVHITVFSQRPVWESPWRFTPVGQGSGTGFVISGKRILTNAHVASWARQIILRRHQDPRPWTARVEFVAHDCDLATLAVDNPAFFDGIQPLEFGALPEVRSSVVTIGYPAGGDQVSYTRGVVSRIEMQNYAHIANRAFLTVQTDAAINPGNSGGPVLQDDKVVGVAFQGTRALENTGFFIPTTIVRHFLDDIADGTYHGFPDGGLMLVPLQNPAQRRALGLDPDGPGARVDSILPFPDTLRLIREDDVLLSVSGLEVGSDATILYQGNRVHAGVAFDEAQHGASVKLDLWRDKRRVSVDLPVFYCRDDRAEGRQYDTPPRYLVFGGLVFTPLSLDYLQTFGNDWRSDVDPEIVYELSSRRLASPSLWRREPVVLAQTLAHPVNANLSVRARALVDKIDGRRIESLEDAAAALESSTNAQVLIQFLPGNQIECLDREAAREANTAILQTFRLPSDRRL